MTLQSPKIYLYKISFEEVPYYYGIHKEKTFNEDYWGSPYTHKWCWEFYTPQKQILQYFDFNDNGYTQAQEIEKRIITPFLYDKWCLNENVGGIVSLHICREAGKIGAQKTKELNIGIHALTKEQTIKNAKIGGRLTSKLKIGVHGRSKEKMTEDGKKGGARTKELGVGIFNLTLEQRRETTKKLNTQKWKCLETGFITSPGPLTIYQKARGIDTSKRERLH
jgi:hypothetical protein